jgi:plasmid stability protein
MAQLTVRNLEQSVKTKLQRRAKRNGHSMEEEVRDILRDAVKNGAVKEEGLGTRMRRRFAGIGVDLQIPERSGEPVRAAVFDE